MARLDDLLRQMKQQGASDLHLTSGSAPYMRINGDMVKLNYRNVSAETCHSLIFEILTEKQRGVVDSLLAESDSLRLSKTPTTTHALLCFSGLPLFMVNSIAALASTVGFLCGNAQ